MSTRRSWRCQWWTGGGPPYNDQPTSLKRCQADAEKVRQERLQGHGRANLVLIQVKETVDGMPGRWKTHERIELPGPQSWVGKSVSFPYGTGTLSGTVTEVYGSSLLHALIELDPDYPEGPTDTVVVTLGELVKNS